MYSVNTSKHGKYFKQIPRKHIIHTNTHTHGHTYYCVKVISKKSKHIEQMFFSIRISSFDITKNTNKRIVSYSLRKTRKIRSMNEYRRNSHMYKVHYTLLFVMITFSMRNEKPLNVHLVVRLSFALNAYIFL